MVTRKADLEDQIQKHQIILRDLVTELTSLNVILSSDVMSGTLAAQERSYGAGPAPGLR